MKRGFGRGVNTGLGLLGAGPGPSQMGQLGGNQGLMQNPQMGGGGGLDQRGIGGPGPMGGGGLGQMGRGGPGPRGGGGQGPPMGPGQRGEGLGPMGPGQRGGGGGTGQMGQYAATQRIMGGGSQMEAGMYPPTTFLGTITIILFPICQPLVCTGTLLFLGQLQLFCFPFPNPRYALAHYFSWDNCFVSHFPSLGTFCMYWRITAFREEEEVELVRWDNMLLPKELWEEVHRWKLVCTLPLLFLGQLQFFCFPFPKP